MRGQRIVRAGKGITLVILNGDMNDIIRVIISPENPGVLIHEVSKTVKHEVKHKKVDFVVRYYEL